MHTRALVLPVRPADVEPAEQRIFVHNPGEAVRCRALGLDESVEHESLKAQLAGAARRSGWRAEVEVWHDDNCRADVVATDPRTGRRHALEAQISPLGLRQAVDRHGRYVDAFGYCTWTHTRRREWSHQIPSLQVGDGDLSTVVGGILVDLVEEREADPQPLETVVGGVLRERLIYIFDNSVQWGSYVVREALSRSSARPRRPRQRIARGGAQRFCDRLLRMDAADRALTAEGFETRAKFIEAHDRAHHQRLTFGEGTLSEAAWRVMALAGQFPELVATG